MVQASDQKNAHTYYLPVVWRYLGEFVHFRSGAAGCDLKKQAEKAFGWNEVY